jgi:hypothetical protein
MVGRGGGVGEHEKKWLLGREGAVREEKNKWDGGGGGRGGMNGNK